MSLRTVFSLLCLHNALGNTKMVLVKELTKQVPLKTSFKVIGFNFHGKKIQKAINI